MASIDPWEDHEVDRQIDKLKQNIQESLQDLDDILKEGDIKMEDAKNMLDDLVACTDVEFNDIFKQLQDRHEVLGIKQKDTLQGGLESQTFSESMLQTLGMDSTRMNLSVSGSATVRFLRSQRNQPKSAPEGYVSLLEKEMVDFRNEKEDTLAHTTVTYHKKPGFMKKLIQVCPALLLTERQRDLQGQTPLHIAIAGENLEMTKTILRFLKKNIDRFHNQLKKAVSELKSLPDIKENSKSRASRKKTIEDLRFQRDLYFQPLKISAKGSRFENTVMLGQLPLSVAALTLNRNTVDLLIRHGAKIHWKNADGENVLHSLVRFASINTHKIKEIEWMMKYIAEKEGDEMNTVMWRREMNCERQTPLRMAAAYGLEQLFGKILKLDGVYHSANYHDGLFGIHLYDITEIDTVTQAEWERYDKLSQKSKENETIGYTKELYHESLSVLEIICQLPHKQAFPFLYLDLIKKVIRLKWRHYKKVFFVWLVLHLMMMMHITALVIYKTQLISSNDLYSSQTENNTRNGKATEEENFVNVSGGFTIVYALLYLIMELFRCIRLKQPLYICRIHHNGTYRLMLLVFSVALMIDTIWFYSRPQNNYFLILALIAGWNFTVFFFRAFKSFSFYSFLYLKVISGDLVRLSVLILFQMLGFSTALYITYKNSKKVSSDFQDLGNTAVTMFKVMLGLSELEFLYKARENWLAISLYVAFVLVCYVILFNSLIAMMSRTCDLVSRDKYQMCKLQRLSVILLLETMVPYCSRYRHLVKREELEGYQLNIEPSRSYLEVTEKNTLKTTSVASSWHIFKPSRKWKQTIRQQEVDITRFNISTSHHTEC